MVIRTGTDCGGRNTRDLFKLQDPKIYPNDAANGRPLRGKSEGSSKSEGSIMKAEMKTDRVDRLDFIQVPGLRSR
jgi:hypothetical protein